MKGTGDYVVPWICAEGLVFIVNLQKHNIVEASEHVGSLGGWSAAIKAWRSVCRAPTAKCRVTRILFNTFGKQNYIERLQCYLINTSRYKISQTEHLCNFTKLKNNRQRSTQDILFNHLILFGGNAGQFILRWFIRIVFQLDNVTNTTLGLSSTFPAYVALVDH